MNNIVDIEKEIDRLKPIAKKKNTQIAIGIGTAVVLIQAIKYFAGINGDDILEMIPHIILCIAPIPLNIIYKRNLKGYVFFGDLFSNGFRTIAVIIIFMIIWTFIGVYLIPGYKESVIEVTKNFWLRTEKIENIQASLDDLKINKIFLLSQIKGYLSTGFLTAIILNLFASIFLRAKGNN